MSLSQILAILIHVLGDLHNVAQTNLIIGKRFIGLYNFIHRIVGKNETKYKDGYQQKVKETECNTIFLTHSIYSKQVYIYIIVCIVGLLLVVFISIFYSHF